MKVLLRDSNPYPSGDEIAVSLHILPVLRDGEQNPSQNGGPIAGRAQPCHQPLKWHNGTDLVHRSTPKEMVGQLLHSVGHQTPSHQGSNGGCGLHPRRPDGTASD